jgi:hypothetical protein
MSLELGRINSTLVADRKRLVDLLREDHPSSVTKSGKEYLFNKEILKIFAEKLPGEIKERLRLPIFFYFDADVMGSALITDEVAVSALQVLGDLSMLRVVREGRLWVGRPIVYAILGKYPTVVQIVMR